MANLDLAELAKQFSTKSPEYPKLRYTKVVEKIASGDPFELSSGGKKKIDYATPAIKKAFVAGDLNKLKGNTALFKELGKSNIIRINQLKKTKEFGGGGGSGAGADVTKLAESAQCLYCALAFHVFKRKMKLDEVITKKNFDAAKRFIDVDEKFESMIANLPDDWIKSSILGANLLFEKYRGKNFIFHRGSRLVDQIENQFKLINRTERAFGDINKWSPADIYMVKPNKNVSSLLTEETLKGLNGEMLKMYNKNEIVGVSLKKMETTARYSEINVNKTKGVTSNIGYKEKIIKANTNATLYDSMDVYIRWGDSPKDRMQLRSFGTGDGLTGWQGELKGETANQGKVSLGPISFIFKQHANVNLPTSNEIATRVKQGDESICTEIYDMAKKLGVNNLPSKNEHIKKCYDQTPKWRYSKYLGLTLLTVLDSVSKKKANEIVQDIYFYAGSKSSFSAPYAKIEG